MREEIYLRYKENLHDADFLVDEEGKPSYHKLVMLTSKRNELKDFLATNNLIENPMGLVDKWAGFPL